MVQSPNEFATGGKEMKPNFRDLVQGTENVDKNTPVTDFPGLIETLEDYFASNNPKSLDDIMSKVVIEESWVKKKPV
jgi:hypothetical protein